jgi:predicted PurR-regulated permease PerM
MTSSESSDNENAFMQHTLEAAIRIGVIAGLVTWCFLIARPFLVPIIWGAIIAIAVFHGYDRLQTALGGRRITAAVLVAFFDASSAGRAIGAPRRFARYRRAQRR